MTELVRSYLDAYNTQAEEAGTGIHFDVIRDSSPVVLNQRIDLLVSNGIVGFLLVLILLALFLNIRLPSGCVLAIPMSHLQDVHFAQHSVTINVISLFGMILVIGILADDGIVIAENIYRHYEMGKDRYRATIDGTMEVLPAVFAAIVTTMGSFSSFFFIEGQIGGLLVTWRRLSC